jgi:hypothetical protein
MLSHLLTVGRNSSLIQVPFLNALGNMKARVDQGAVVRVGGNSQERSLLYPNNGFGNFRAINKTKDPTIDVRVHSTTLLPSSNANL